MNIVPEIRKEEKEMRAVFKETLCKLINEDPNVVALDSDLLAAAGAKTGYAPDTLQADYKNL